MLFKCTIVLFFIILKSTAQISLSNLCFRAWECFSIWSEGAGLQGHNVLFLLLFQAFKWKLDRRWKMFCCLTQQKENQTEPKRRQENWTDCSDLWPGRGSRRANTGFLLLLAAWYIFIYYIHNSLSGTGSRYPLCCDMAVRNVCTNRTPPPLPPYDPFSASKSVKSISKVNNSWRAWDSKPGLPARSGGAGVSYLQVQTVETRWLQRIVGMTFVFASLCATITIIFLKKERNEMPESSVLSPLFAASC